MLFLRNKGNKIDACKDQAGRYVGMLAGMEAGNQICEWLSPVDGDRGSGSCMPERCFQPCRRGKSHAVTAGFRWIMSDASCWMYHSGGG